MKQFIYADNAATTKLDPAALEAMMPWLTEEYGNPSQPYSFSRGPQKALARARETIAACIGTLPEEIYFTSGGTEGDNWAIKGTTSAQTQKGFLLTSAFEHHAILHATKAIEELGYPVVYMEPSAAGFITSRILRNHISDETCMVSVMMVNNELGTIQPIEELCSIAHKHGAIFHTDAVQAVGHVPIDVKKLGVDLLSASSHKFNGPRGVGFLYIRRDTPIRPYADGGAQEHGMRAGTENIAGIVGMAIALKRNCEEVRENTKYIIALEEHLLQCLNVRGISYIRNGASPHLPGILNISFTGKDGEVILHRMDLMGIAVATGSACDSVNTKISHVLKAIKLDEEQAKGTIRISFGKDNTKADAEAIAVALGKIV